MKVIRLRCDTAYIHKHVWRILKKKRKKRKEVRWNFRAHIWFSFSVIVLHFVCFDGLELFLVYKLQYKEAAADGNGVYFCSK